MPATALPSLAKRYWQINIAEDPDRIEEPMPDRAKWLKIPLSDFCPRKPTGIRCQKTIIEEIYSANREAFEMIARKDDYEKKKGNRNE